MEHNMYGYMSGCRACSMMFDILPFIIGGGEVLWDDILFYKLDHIISNVIIAQTFLG